MEVCVSVIHERINLCVGKMEENLTIAAGVYLYYILLHYIISYIICGIYSLTYMYYIQCTYTCMYNISHIYVREYMHMYI